MPLQERIDRHAKMLAHLMENDIDRWVATFLSALAETRQRPGVMDTLRHLFELGGLTGTADHRGNARQ
jgi:trehalose 6-phosphate synthase